jgi:uncharacterized protein YkwD
MSDKNISLEILIELHNKARSSTWIKKPKLLYKNIDLMTYAQAHAEYMSHKKSLVHSRIQDIMNLGFRDVAENIAWGQATEESVMSSWLWSMGHRANIMRSTYNSIGCGVAFDDNDKPYWCVVFGKQ